MSTPEGRTQALAAAIAAIEAELAELDSRQANLERRRAELREKATEAFPEDGAVGASQNVGSSVLDPRGKVALFRGLFRGREDVFPRLWVNAVLRTSTTASGPTSTSRRSSTPLSALIAFPERKPLKPYETRSSRSCSTNFPAHFHPFSTTLFNFLKRLNGFLQDSAGSESNLSGIDTNTRHSVWNPQVSFRFFRRIERSRLFV